MSKQGKKQGASSQPRAAGLGGADLGVTIAELFYWAADLRSSNPEAARILHYAARDLERPSTGEDLQFREAVLSETVLSAIEQSLYSRH